MPKFELLVRGEWITIESESDLLARPTPGMPRFRELDEALDLWTPDAVIRCSDISIIRRDTRR